MLILDLLEAEMVPLLVLLPSLRGVGPCVPHLVGRVHPGTLWTDLPGAGQLGVRD